MSGCNCGRQTVRATGVQGRATCWPGEEDEWFGWRWGWQACGLSRQARRGKGISRRRAGAKMRGQACEWCVQRTMSHSRAFFTVATSERAHNRLSFFFSFLNTAPIKRDPNSQYRKYMPVTPLPSDTEEVRMPEPTKNLNPSKNLTLVLLETPISCCWTGVCSLGNLKHALVAPYLYS